METFGDLLRARAGDPHSALWFEGSQVSWDELVAGAAARAHLALELPGDGPRHVGVLLDNVPEHLLWIAGAALGGYCVVGVNPTRRGEQLAADVRHTECRAVVTDRAHARLLSGLDLGVELVVSVDDPGYQQAVADAEGAGLPDVAVSPEDRLLLLFTSGSTGAPKAVVVGQGRLAAIARRTPGLFGIDRGTVTYQSMPLCHGNAVMANWAPVCATGATMAMRRSFSASGFLDDVRASGATYFNYVGRALAYVLATPERPDDAENPLRLGFGTEASERDRDEFSRRFGCELLDTYGSSEGAISTAKPPGTPAGSIGLPPEGVDVAVVDPVTLVERPRARFDASGRLVNGDEAIGELVGRNVAGAFEGYYRNPEATTERLRNGWYWSGDLAYRDEDGWLYFAGRSGDWLRVDGENFAAGPVEQVLARFPDAVTVAVYPVPDPQTGDEVMAALELLPSRHFDAATFAAFLGAQRDLGTKWAPRYVRHVAAMPLTATHKVAKAELRRAAWETDDPVWVRAGRDLVYEPLTEAGRLELHRRFAEHGRSDLLP